MSDEQIFDNFQSKMLENPHLKSVTFSPLVEEEQWNLHEWVFSTTLDHVEVEIGSASYGGPYRRHNDLTVYFYGNENDIGEVRVSDNNFLDMTAERFAQRVVNYIKKTHLSNALP